MRFCFLGYVNSQNMRCWSAENPHVFGETRLHLVKIGTWCAMSRRRIIGPSFDETLTTQRYRNNILTAFVQELQDDELQDDFFQPDGAKEHTTVNNLNFLREFFDDRVMFTIKS